MGPSPERQRGPLCQASNVGPIFHALALRPRAGCFHLWHQIGSALPLGTTRQPAALRLKMRMATQRWKQRESAHELLRSHFHPPQAQQRVA